VAAVNEGMIRDNLASVLDKMEPGLALLRKEQYLPSELGTRSFIDLFAKGAMKS
jgi:hypothetical protein